MRHIQTHFTVIILSLMLLNSCATSYVRSDSKATPPHVYPATAMDADFFFETAVKGKPMIENEDPEYREDGVTRVFSGVTAIIDLPISLVVDTLLLPVDIKRINRASEKQKPE